MKYFVHAARNVENVRGGQIYKPWLPRQIVRKHSGQSGAQKKATSFANPGRQYDFGRKYFGPKILISTLNYVAHTFEKL